MRERKFPWTVYTDKSFFGYLLIESLCNEKSKTRSISIKKYDFQIYSEDPNKRGDCVNYYKRVEINGGPVF